MMQRRIVVSAVSVVVLVMAGRSDDSDDTTCGGPGPTGEDGTLILAHNYGVTTVPVVFAGTPVSSGVPRYLPRRSSK